MYIYTKAFIITTVITAPFVYLLWDNFNDYFAVGYYVGVVVATINFMIVELLRKYKKESK